MTERDTETNHDLISRHPILMPTTQESSWMDTIRQTWGQQSASDTSVLAAGAAAAAVAVGAALRFRTPAAGLKAVAEIASNYLGGTGSKIAQTTITETAASNTAIKSAPHVLAPRAITGSPVYIGETGSTAVARSMTKDLFDESFFASGSLASPAIHTFQNGAVRSVMNRSDTVIELGEGLAAKAQSWKEFRPTLNRLGKADNEVAAALEAAQKRINDKGGIFDLNLLNSKELEAVQNWPGLESARRSVQTVIARKAEQREIETEAKGQLLSQSKDWTKTYHEFANKHELPKARYEFKPLDRDNGQYLNSAMTIHTGVFMVKRDIPSAVQIAVHEATHHEQTYLRVALSADELGIGQTATGLQLNQLERRVADVIDAKYIPPYLAMRAGRRLGLNEELRAGLLRDSHRQLDNLIQPQSIKYNQEWVDYLRGLPTKDSVATLFRNEGDTAAAALAADLKGSPAMQKVLSDFAGAYGRIDATWSPRYAKRVTEMLEGHFDRAGRLWGERQRQWEHAYGASLHEREAWDNGRIVLEHLLKK